MQDILHNSKLLAAEDMNMLWIVLLAIVVLGATAVSNQAHKSDEAARHSHLVREYIF